MSTKKMMPIRKRLRVAWDALVKGKIPEEKPAQPLVVRLEIPSPCSKCVSLVELEALSHAAYEGARQAMDERKAQQEVKV